MIDVPWHIWTILLRRAQIFFKADFVALEEFPYGVATACNPMLMRDRDLSNVKSGCFSISVSSQGACASNVDVLPPRGLAAQLPVS